MGSVRANSEHTSNFQEHWEESLFLVMFKPLAIILGVVSMILRPIYTLLALLVFPVTLIELLTNLLWIIVMVAIYAVAFISRHINWVRPVSYVLVLPFVIFGLFIVSISPPKRMGDLDGAIRKSGRIEFIRK